MTAPPAYPGWIAVRKRGDGNAELITWTPEQGLTRCLVTGADVDAALRRWQARTVGAASNDSARTGRGPDAL